MTLASNDEGIQKERCGMWGTGCGIWNLRYEMNDGSLTVGVSGILNRTAHITHLTSFQIPNFAIDTILHLVFAKIFR